MSSKTINFGVLYLPNYQYLDAAGPMDYLNNHAKPMMSLLGPAYSLVEKAPTIIWHYISSDLSPLISSSGPVHTPSCTYDDCPKLDYLLVPGPDPNRVLPDACVEFLRKKFNEIEALLLVCTGSLAVAQTGLLDGLNVCSNKMSLRMFSEAGTLRKEVKWVGDRRWIVDGKVWSAAGITAGIDLAAEFARVHFDHDVVEIVKDISEYAPNPAKPDQFARILSGVAL